MIGTWYGEGLYQEKRLLRVLGSTAYYEVNSHFKKHPLTPSIGVSGQLSSFTAYTVLRLEI